MTSQRISKWLAAITEDGRKTFFKDWGNRVSEQHFLCHDITSVSSCAELNEYVHYGYNHNGEPLPTGSADIRNTLGDYL